MQTKDTNGEWGIPEPVTPGALEKALKDPKIKEVRIAKENTPEYQKMLKRLRQQRKAKRRALAKQRKRSKK